MKFSTQAYHYANYPFLPPYQYMILTKKLIYSQKNIKSRKYIVKYLIRNKHSIIDSKGMVLNSVVCVTKAS